MNKLKTIEDVSFTITEDCSFECAHCLRGDRRHNSIRKEIIDSFLSQIEILGKVMITGGEPLMKIELVSHLINQIYEQGSNPKLIKIVTNGSVSPQKFEEYVKILRSNNVPEAKVIVSNDFYHFKELQKLCGYNVEEIAMKYAKILTYYGYPKSLYDVLEEYRTFGENIEAVGRGVNIEGAVVRDRKFDFRSNHVSATYNWVEGRIVLNADGKVIPELNISWEEIDKYYGDECNILKHSLKEILTRR